MFCLFKNSHIHPRINLYVVLVSLLSVVAWLYFAFIEKELVTKLFEGQAIMVDLLLGIPLVLMLAVVVYATVYWFFKLLIVYFLPQAIVPAQQFETLDDEMTEETLESLQEQLGEEYWSDSEERAQETLKQAQSPLPKKATTDEEKDK
ncbi:hypothetical protein [Thiomicrorhabdus chilensis]|uniref:hypothetical protein n=1 Tax=Thiomicrorhabdus chilensis TaxID=63656 RepID=UPI000683F479|nr:hypothetical protein [Thiomicrorhabdus chilensis]